jgi:glucose-6-phosphate isomerase
MDLKKISGLPLYLENGKVVLSEGIISLPETYRKIEEAKPYLMEESADFGLDWLYAMRRGVHFERDKGLFDKKGLRYDITDMAPGLIGKEFVKTIGHYHKDSSSEVYEVLCGEAFFLFQKINLNGRADEIYLIKAETGQKIVIPPGYGHITINPGSDYLIVSDMSSVDMRPDYDFFKNFRGAGYYIVESGAAVKNKNYSSVGELKIGRPKEIPELKISFSKPLYESFAENPENFDFIRNSEKYEKILTPENLFEF